MLQLQQKSRDRILKEKDKMPILRKQNAIQTKKRNNTRKSKMKTEATIKAYSDPEKLIKCFKPEEGKQKRSTYKTKKEKDHVLFEIKAEDSTALRSIMNSITKLLTIYEKFENFSK